MLYQLLFGSAQHTPIVTGVNKDRILSSFRREKPAAAYVETTRNGSCSATKDTYNLPINNILVAKNDLPGGALSDSTLAGNAAQNGVQTLIVL